MAARRRRRKSTRPSSSPSPASISRIPAKKPPQSVRPGPVNPSIQLTDLVAATENWSAMVVVMCLCGWDMDMSGAAAYCTNPCCERRTRLYHVHLKITEVDGIRA